jgi:hypothetical protein
MMWVDILRYVVVGALSSLLSIIVMLVRERNAFSTKMMDLFLEDKKNWTQEREKLELRVDELYEKYDSLRDKYEQVLLLSREK